MALGERLRCVRVAQQEVHDLCAEAMPLREQVARLTASGEHLAAELLILARTDGKAKK